MSTAIEVPKTGALDRSNRKSRSNFDQARQRFFRQKLAVVGLVIVVLFILTAIFAPLLAPTGYAEASLRNANQFPSWEYPFGTDPIGHDMLSRVIFGIRTSLIVAFSAVGMACVIGLPLGIAAGLKGGWVDFFVLRIVEIMTALPGILFAIFLMSVISSGAFANIIPGGQVFNVALVIAVTSWVPLVSTDACPDPDPQGAGVRDGGAQCWRNRSSGRADPPVSKRNTTYDRRTHPRNSGGDLCRGWLELSWYRHQ